MPMAYLRAEAEFPRGYLQAMAHSTAERLQRFEQYLEFRSADSRLWAPSEIKSLPINHLYSKPSSMVNSMNKGLQMKPSISHIELS